MNYDQAFEFWARYYFECERFERLLPHTISKYGEAMTTYTVKMFKPNRGSQFQPFEIAMTLDEEKKLVCEIAALDADAAAAVAQCLMPEYIVLEVREK